jgi:hypothetical protein
MEEVSLRQSFPAGLESRRVMSLTVSADVPEGTEIRFRIRTRVNQEAWTEWRDLTSLDRLPPGHETEVEAVLHTDDGCLTPRLVAMQPVWSPTIE